MQDEAQDTLAAEYVLGTLTAEEREQAEALRSFDPGFDASVRQWERRLGELNVMVEAIEPPAETWDNIKTRIGTLELNSEIETLHEPPALPPAASLDTDWLPPPLPTEFPELGETLPPPPPSDIVEAFPSPPFAAAPPPPFAAAAPSQQPTTIERSADVIYLAQRVTRWRRVTYGLGALAALLAIYIAVSQIAPGLMPPQWRMPLGGIMMTRSERPAARAPQDRLVAVLQQGPNAPAFLLTVDTQQRKLFVRRVSATTEAGKSYELWLISSRFPAPRSLGTVGADEFTQRALPGNYDVDTLRAATYAVSLEPAGGSTKGVPTGPVLFTGRAVESLPASPPPTPKT